MRTLEIVILLFISSTLLLSCEEKKYADPLSPNEALNSFQIHEDFRIEIFASEPHVFDPVEMVFDENGTAYVVEMYDYPYKPEKGKERGRIKVLFDTDGDGAVDDTRTFADGLLEATSILPWEDGLLVTAAPHILYLKDTNNDYSADIREIVFSGFFENNSEAQITNLRFGIDNWIYASNNGQAGTITYHRKPDMPPLDVRAADFRFRLEKDLFECEAGTAQFGHTLDDWGNRFITQNTLHVRHVVIPWRYIHRHPYLPSTRVGLNISDHDLDMFQDTPPPYWRAERTRRRQKEYDEQGLERIEWAEDHFTGCSGGTIYDGDAFPEGFYGTLFTGEVAGNLIHRDLLGPLEDSPTFVAQRDDKEKQKEFLSSTDPWFRPASFTVGPDGYLYVLDYYRQHIETPLSIPEDLKEEMDFYNGSDMGRIYRILPKDAPSVRTPLPKLGGAPGKDLVKALEHPNRRVRLTAQRLLLERQDTTTVLALTEMFETHHDPRARLHAFYALEGMDALTDSIVVKALSDKHPGVRKHGAILSEKYLGGKNGLILLTNDEDIHVATQAVLSLGVYPANETNVQGMASGLLKYAGNEWYRMAVLSSETGSSISMFDYLYKSGLFFQHASEGNVQFIKGLSHTIVRRNDEGELEKLLLTVLGEDIKDVIWKKVALEGVTEGLSRVEDKASRQVIIEGVLDKTGASKDEELAGVIQVLEDVLGGGK